MLECKKRRIFIIKIINIIKEQFIENNNKNFDYNTSYESNQLVEQFLSNNNRLEY